VLLTFGGAAHNSRHAHVNAVSRPRRTYLGVGGATRLGAVAVGVVLQEVGDVFFKVGRHRPNSVLPEADGAVVASLRYAICNTPPQIEKLFLHCRAVTIKKGTAHKSYDIAFIFALFKFQFLPGMLCRCIFSDE
jgi:hypothetical protein